MSSDDGFVGDGGGAQPPPGPGAGVSAGVLGLLGAGDAAVAAYAARLSDFDLVAEMAEPEVLESWSFAIRMRMLATLYGRPVMVPRQPAPDDPSGEGAEPNGRKRRRRYKGLSREDLTVAEAAAAFAITPHRAAMLLTMARALSTRLVETMAGLWDRRVNSYKAQLVVELVGPMAEYVYEQAIAAGKSPLEAERAARAKAREVEDRVLGAAAGQTPSVFRQRVRRAIASVHPKYAAMMARRAGRRRNVPLRTAVPDGMAIISAELCAADAIEIWKTLDGEARLQREHGDERTLDQLRADVLKYFITHPGDRPDWETQNATAPPNHAEADSADADSADADNADLVNSDVGNSDPDDDADDNS
jgi:hypothetical protein